jgi:hypothetical protein
MAVICLLTAVSGCSNVTNSDDSSSDTTSSTGTTTTSSSTSGTTKKVTISNASTSVSYSGALVIDGTTASYSNQTFTSTSSNQVAVLVINGGSLTLTAVQ